MGCNNLAIKKGVPVEQVLSRDPFFVAINEDNKTDITGKAGII